MITLSDVHLHPVCRGVRPTFRSAYDHARLSSRVALVTRGAVAALTAALLMMYAGAAQAATVLERYYAHDAVEDAHGVMAPWHQGQNGQIDLRVRTAAEFLKRYPWVTADESLMAGPHYVFNARVDVAPDGAVAVLPASDQMNGNLGQRFKYISESLPRYYRYTGDPMAFSHMRIAADFLLDYYVTPSDHAWPEFPISVPLAGRPYGPAEPGGYIQLDLSAGIGRGMIRAYQMTGDTRYLEAAKHWGDVFADHCDRQPGARPWPRYANPEEVPWAREGTGNIQTGGVANVLLFLDELIALGYTGRGDAIVTARDAGRAYLRDTLLPAWYVWDTWGRHYWDWEHPVQGIVTTGWTAEYLMNHKDVFPNWRYDVRNILSLYFHHACVSPNSNGDVYSGAWAYPEGPSCCGRSLDFCPVFLSRYMARYAVEANSEWAREIARREITLGFYHFHATGQVEDNIDGGQITAANWSELIGLGPVLCGLEVLEWLPELGPSRENHIMRSSSPVTSAVYGAGRIDYTTFDAPAGGIDVLRLAYRPESVTADGRALALRDDLDGLGYAVRALPDGDCLVSVRHDGLTSITVLGEDPMGVTDDEDLEYEGPWRSEPDPGASGGTICVAEAAGAVMTHRFHGNQVRLIGRADASGGLADVYLDGVRQQTCVDCWIPASRLDRQVLYYCSGLPEGPHELKVVARGDKRPTARGAAVYIDEVQYSAAAGVRAESGGGPAEPQRMILGYTRREPYVDTAGHAWLPATEVVVRTGHHTDPVALTWWTEPTVEPVADTPDPELYRYGMHAGDFWANVTVAPGTYTVRIRLAERRNGSDPKRTPMDIRINGSAVGTSVDVATDAGGFGRALDLRYDGISPQNGIIELRFTAAEGGEAIAQALEVIPSEAAAPASP